MERLNWIQYLTCGFAIAISAVDNSCNVQLEDPATWPVITSLLRRTIVAKGPVQAKLRTYPKRNNFSFQHHHYVKTCPNGEAVNRDWLVYSVSSNSLFCFPCSVFASASNTTGGPISWQNYGGVGFQDFANQARSIKSHENSQSHFQSSITWKEFIKRQSDLQSIDSQAARLQEEEFSFWKSVLHPVLDAIIYCARNNLAFRGSSDNINDSNCGNFLSLIKLLAKYHSTLAIHLQRMEKGKISYLSPRIQNEFIDVVAGTVRTSIIQDITNRKYFSLLLDATPDTSKKEQISQIIRTVKVSVDGCQVEELFVDFIHFDLKTGEEISGMIMRKLEEDGIDVQNCRGQGFDNGANMAGVYKGVQARIQKINKNAFFVPCAAHSLNLIGQNAFEKDLSGKLLSGQIQNIFNFFSASPIRWSILKKHVKRTVKSLSSTRWSAKALAVSILSSEFRGILNALEEMKKSTEVNSQTLAEATNMRKSMPNFKFLVGIKIWEKLLVRIDLSNKYLQNENISVEQAAKNLQGLLEWLQSSREVMFDECWESAVATAQELGIDESTGFPQQRKNRGRKPKRYRTEGEPDRCVANQTLSNKARFKLQFYDKLMENLLSAFETRFTSLMQANDNFSFLWGQKLNSLSSLEMRSHSIKLAAIYSTDFNPGEFAVEAEYLKSAIHPFSNSIQETSPLDVLNILTREKLDSLFINCHTALRIFLTLPVTVASNERSFSKLKIIKNYLRSSMGQDRLSNLGIMSIEHERLGMIPRDEMIHQFCMLKCRRVPIL